MAEGGFDFQKFIADSKAALLSPAEHFKTMPKEGGFGEPLIKALIYGLIAGIISLIWTVSGMAPSMGMLFGETAAGIMTIVSPLLFALIGLFIGGVIILIISAICSGSTNFETNVRVCAALMVLSPVNALLGFTGGISLYLGIIVGLAVSLYGLWMMFNALKGTLAAKESTAKVISVILAILTTAIMLGSATCMHKAANMSGKFGEDMFKNIPGADGEEIFKNIPETDQEEMKKLMEDSLNKLRELQKKDQ